jgi:hypothetical protein
MVLRGFCRIFYQRTAKVGILAILARAEPGIFWVATKLVVLCIKNKFSITLKICPTAPIKVKKSR